MAQIYDQRYLGWLGVSLLGSVKSIIVDESDFIKEHNEKIPDHTRRDKQANTHCMRFLESQRE